jgi:hypothetical protein
MLDINKPAYNSGFAQAGQTSKLHHLIAIGLQLTGLTSSKAAPANCYPPLADKQS